ncbi:Dps family protein [Algicola sagamiensis]|uniref:Dps family protein n=1 Tax=Algicola sagamiensis TaxID=163869 RepID=UPI000368F045|nr:Dps family protein [Algicola sagamiensis]
MEALSQIGLEKEGSDNLAEKLNELLANYQILYMNVRGFHWNIRGESFFELHAKFEETYNDLLMKVDEIAERVLTLGSVPVHAYSDYIKDSTIEESENLTNGAECVSSLLKSFQILLRMQREILDDAAELSDEGTASLMSDYIKEQEKSIWMLNAYLGH